MFPVPISSHPGFHVVQTLILVVSFYEWLHSAMQRCLVLYRAEHMKTYQGFSACLTGLITVRPCDGGFEH